MLRYCRGIADVGIGGCAVVAVPALVGIVRSVVSMATLFAIGLMASAADPVAPLIARYSTFCCVVYVTVDGADYNREVDPSTTTSIVVTGSAIRSASYTESYVVHELVYLG